jgi:hypothetical protein
VALSPAGHLAVDGRNWGRLWVRDARTTEPRFDLEPKGIERCFTCRFNRSGEVLFAGFLRSLFLVDPERHEILVAMGRSGASENIPFDGVRAIGIDPNDQFFVAGDSQGYLAAFNRTYEIFAYTELASPPSAIEILSNQQVLVLEETGRLTLRDPYLRIVAEWPNAGGRSWGLSVAADEESFVTSHGERIAWWSTRSRDEPRLVAGGIGEIECLELTAAGCVLVAGGRTGLLRFWSAASGEGLLDLQFPSAVENLATSDGGSTVLVSLSQATLVCLDVAGLP